MKFVSTKKPSKWLAKEDLPNGKALVTIRGFSEANVARDNDAPEIKNIIHFAEFQKGMVFNPTNQAKLCFALGLDVKSWDTDQAIGKRVVIFNDPEVTDLKGNYVGGLRIRQYNQRPDVQPQQQPQPQAQQATKAWPMTAPSPHVSQTAGVPNDQFDDDIPF